MLMLVGWLKGMEIYVLDFKGACCMNQASIPAWHKLVQFPKQVLFYQPFDIIVVHTLVYFKSCSLLTSEVAKGAELVIDKLSFRLRFVGMSYNP